MHRALVAFFFLKKKKENSAFDVGHAVQVVTFFFSNI